MKRIFSDLSVSKKTIVLLLVFVLMPTLFAQSVIFDKFNAREIASEIKVARQKLKNTSDSLTSYMENILEVADEIGYERSVNEIVAGEGARDCYTKANARFKEILKYNQYIVKIQLLRGDEIIWQYGMREGYSFGESENAPYAELVQNAKSYDVWTPGHLMHLLEKGEFTREKWFSSYYHGIYDPKSLVLQGVLALHIPEETFCSLYENCVEDSTSVCWVSNQDGQIISATDKTFFTEGFPEELDFDLQSQKEGAEELLYQGKKVIVLWDACGDTGNILFHMRGLSGMKTDGIIYVIIVLFVFCIFCIGFLLAYNRFVLRPLSVLSGRIENTHNLDQQQELIPVCDDEIGRLTKAYSDMMRRINQLVQDVYVATIRTQEAEKEAMLAQINPHFLYNTLESIRWNAMMNGDREVGRQLEALSVMLREILNFGNKYTTLNQEISIIQNYCYLLQARFRKDIEIQIEMDPENGIFEIPKLLIQPLVENAYKHGLENKMGDKKIWVKVKRFHCRLIIYVADNGAGCDAAEIRKSIAGSGKECFALKNIRERIHMEYGEEGRLAFYSHPGKGTLVKLFLKLKEKEL